jgi:hypothetical protein
MHHTNNEIENKVNEGKHLFWVEWPLQAVLTRKSILDFHFNPEITQKLLVYLLIWHKV